MMMKVALLLLALAAPMISAGGKKCRLAAGLLVSGACGDCSDSRSPGLQNWAKNCCAKCPKLKCHKAWEKIDHKKCRNCDNLRDLAIKWKCKKHGGGYGHGGGDGYDYSTCKLYPNKNGHDYGQCDYECNRYPERDYGYETQPAYATYCTKKSNKQLYPDPYSYAEANAVYGYGDKYDVDNCHADYPLNTEEYLYAARVCGKGYAKEQCPESKCEYGKPIYDEQNCAYKTKCTDYNTCPPCHKTECPKYADAALGSSGETTNETVQTLSWVLIAIAAALFLASIAFCAVGRRERKAHAAENVHVNALA